MNAANTSATATDASRITAEPRTQEEQPLSTETEVISQQDDAPPSRDELLELVRAIKFANPDLSQRAVHKEISQVLALKAPCLKAVQLQDVKKVWKKATQHNYNNSTSKTVLQEDNQATPPSSNNSNCNADLVEKLQGTTPKVYTVGDGSTVYHVLAQEYTAAHLAQQAAQEEAAALELATNYVHVFLDVPADKSGQRPHQALINFQQQTPSTTTTETKKSSSKQKESHGDKIIVKIQRAAPPVPPASSDDTTPQEEEEEEIKYPMLLYNQSRTLKTFIHPDPNDNGYETIERLIIEQGTGGVLGQAGGTKAYFWAHLTKHSNTNKPSKKGIPNILSISIKDDELAPPQDW